MNLARSGALHMTQKPRPGHLMNNYEIFELVTIFYPQEWAFMLCKIRFLPISCVVQSRPCAGFFVFEPETVISMPSVRIKENEYFDAALRRFKRACEKAGVLTELRRREFYEKPTQERKRKKAAAVKRHLKRISRDVSRRKRLY